ncbi:unnamed protein product [Rotaria sp. Silwood1]|nr:unnamed protein product [Rotaria sp. Silwood1]
MEANDIITETMAFGRSFRLGMLYDCRCDKLFPGISLWDNEVLKRIQDISNLQTHSTYKIKRENSLHDKLDLLGIVGSLKISLLNGLIDVYGSTNYINDHKMTEQQQRMILKYSTKLRSEHLKMEDLSSYKMINTELVQQDIATHVVVGIIYGIEAFFIFDRILSKNTDSTLMDEDIRVLVNKIPKFAISNKRKLYLNTYEKKIANSLSYAFYGDFTVKRNPNTFDEVAELYKQLQIYHGWKGRNAVAKQIHLFPLCLLSQQKILIINEISNTLLNQCVSLIDDLHTLKIQAEYLINQEHSIVYLNKKYLTIFAQYIHELEMDIQNTMKELLPNIRGNSIDETALDDYLKTIQSSSFNCQALHKWINIKRREIIMEDTFVRSIVEEEKEYVHLSPSALDDMLNDIRCDFVFCLSFHLTDENDSFLNDLRNYLDHKTSIQSPNETRISWVENEEMITSRRKNVKLFHELVKANRRNHKIRFVINDQYKDKKLDGILIHFYENGLKKDFEIPSKPDRPVSKEIYHDRVLLAWTKPPHSHDHMSQYKILYKQKKHKHWTSSLTAINDPQAILIENLRSNVEYTFKMQVMSNIGVVMESDSSDPIVTKLVLPHMRFDARWVQNGIIVAGGYGEGEAFNQLSLPHGLYVNDDDTILIVDLANHRIVEWKYDATFGQVVAGGNGKGNRIDQLNRPTDVITDKKTDSLIICDRGNRRVVRWSRRKGTTSGEIIIEDIDCWGLTIDDQGFFYVSDYKKDEVRRYRIGETNGTLVAGGNGHGNRLNQLDWPQYIAVDQDYSVYVSDWNNHRVIKWIEGATEGIVVAGGRGKGYDFTQLSYPNGIFVDPFGTVYVADQGNHRVMRWLKGSTEGNLIAGGYGEGNRADQLSSPAGLSLDRRGNLYVADSKNNRVQRFLIQAS